MARFRPCNPSPFVHIALIPQGPRPSGSLNSTLKPLTGPYPMSQRPTRKDLAQSANAVRRYSDMTQAQLIADSLASFRARLTDLAGRLSVSVLYGSGYMILADSPVIGSETGAVIALVLGRFERPGHYAPNAPRCFASLSLASDSLCGVCLYPREDAEINLFKMRADPTLASLTNWRVRHIRTEQEMRLVMLREMIATLEAIPV